MSNSQTGPEKPSYYQPDGVRDHLRVCECVTYTCVCVWGVCVGEGGDTWRKVNTALGQRACYLEQSGEPQ